MEIAMKIVPAEAEAVQLITVTILAKGGAITPPHVMITAQATPVKPAAAVRPVAPRIIAVIAPIKVTVL